MNSLQRALDPLSGPVKPRNRRRNPLWRFRRFLFVLALLMVLGFGAILYIFSETPLPEDRIGELAQTSFLCLADVSEGCGPDNATAMLSTGGEDREIVTFEELPPQLINAVVATEDQDFWNHRGVDPRGIARAAYQYVKQRYLGGGEVSLQGGSTITQQYVKLAFTDDEDNLVRKAREAIRAVKLEQDLAAECSERPDLGDLAPAECAKQEILTRYLNRAYFGRGASGVASASRTYFGKDISELTVAESAYLAGLLRNPNSADPELDPDEANRRRGVGLDLMLEAALITPEEHAAGHAEPWDVEARQSREGLGEVKWSEYGSEYFVEEVRKELDELYPDGDIYTRGLRVYTTLDPNLQRAAYAAAHEPKDEVLEERELSQLGPAFLDPNNPDDPSAALVSLDGNGRVVAMLGGTNFAESEFNLATSSDGPGRQPGSTFKALGLATAIEQGISAESLYPAPPGQMLIGEPCEGQDGPWPVSGGASASNRYRSLVDALRWSSNIVFAQLVVDIGPDQLREKANQMGVTANLADESNGTLSTPCSLILGSKEVSVLDMATAFSTLERAGVRIDPVIIDRVEDAEGTVLCYHPVNGQCSESPQREGQQVLDPSTAHQTIYVMTQVVEGGTGQQAVFSEERPIAGKTGTSQNHRDGWFAGFTCDLTTVVWMGYESDKPMIDFRMPHEDGTVGVTYDEANKPIDTDWPNVQGGDFPSWIWSAYMAEATASAPPCESLEIESELTGIIYNPELSVSTLPPCGYELDQYGFPRGVKPEDFVAVTTTTPPDTQPPSATDQPEGLPVQNGNGNGNRGNRNRQDDDDDGGGETPPTGPPCVPIDQWLYQRDPGAAPTTDPNATTSSIDPSAPSTDQNGSTTQSTSTTRPAITLPTIRPPGSSQPTDPPTTAPPTSAPDPTEPPDDTSSSSDDDSGGRG